MTVISEKVKARKPLTLTQKIKVLKDTRKILADPKNWTKGTWIVANDGTGRENVYEPSRSENAAMCVMGAVAAAAGCQGDSSSAMSNLVGCSIASAMYGALPETARVSDYYIEQCYNETTYWDDEELSFDEYLKKNKITATQWYVQYAEDNALEEIYGYNDEETRTHEEVLELLDTAISNLEAQKANG